MDQSGGFRIMVTGFALSALCALAACARSESSNAIAHAPLPMASAATAVDPTTDSAARQPHPDKEPSFFFGRERVRVADLYSALRAQADANAQSVAIRREYAELLAVHRLPDGERLDERLYADYARIRLAFELTRAGGLWGLEWRVTDELPQSDRIWAQWRSTSFDAETATLRTTAIAECDELSALFASVAHGMGLSDRSRVGLLWPTSNHTVAVWVIVGKNGKEAARIVVPTSQIFLDQSQSLDTRGFDPWKQPKIYDYRRADVSPQAELPAPLARYFASQAVRFGSLSRSKLQAMRNRREYEQRLAATGR
jgi:hypothetical protein